MKKAAFARSPILSFVSLLCIVAVVEGQDFAPSLKWGGEVRFRGEVDGRDFANSTPPNMYSLSRIRLGVDATPAEHVRVFIQAQDSRVLGSETDTKGFNTLADSKNLDLHQGFLELKELWVSELTLRLGRQEMSFGNERLVGAVNWHNVGRSFDGITAKLGFETFSMDAFAMVTGEVHSSVAVATPAAVQPVRDDGQRFAGVNASVKTIGNHSMDFYLFYQGNRHQSVPDVDDLGRYTIGTYQKGNMGGFTYETEVAYQVGKISGADISAYLVSLNGGYSIPGSALRNFGVGCDILSGTSPGDAKFKSFDPMYHTGHKFYGFMDYFINIPANTANRGLIDLFGKASIIISDAVDASVAIHTMSLAQELSGEKTAGQECDITGVYRYNKVVRIEGGISGFIPGPVMVNAFGHQDVGFWGYLSTTVTF